MIGIARRISRRLPRIFSLRPAGALVSGRSRKFVDFVKILLAALTVIDR
jgi:hypothetical protein